MSPPPVLPLRRAAESAFGVDFSSILKRHEEATQATPSVRRSKRGSTNTSLVTRSESRPNVRDFAEDTKSKFLPSAFRRISRSPPKMASPFKRSSPGKDVDERKESEVPTSKPNYSVHRRQIDSIRDSVAQHAAPAGLMPVDVVAAQSPQQKSIGGSEAATRQDSSVRDSTISNRHSKIPSRLSAASGADDNFSDISSAVISDAQSVPFQRPKSTQETGNTAVSLLGPHPLAHCHRFPRAWTSSCQRRLD